MSYARPAARAHTLALIRALRERGTVKPKKRLGRIPRPVPPTRIQDEYSAAIRRYVCEAAREALMREWPEIRDALTMHRALSHGKVDSRPRRDDLGDDLDWASEQGKRAARAIDRAAREFADALDPTALREIVSKFVGRMSYHARLQLDQMLRSAIGVSLDAIERPIVDRTEEWSAQNVSLIKTVPSRYFDEIRAHVWDAFEAGEHPDELADQLQDVYSMSEWNAERIARTETLKLSSQLNRDRMESLGVEYAFWRTMRDGRVSEDCAALEGTRFNLAEGVDGVFPGTEHPLCFPGGAPVRLFDAVVTKAYRRRYVGRMVTFLAGGETVSLTPNHPMLTTRGWVAAHLLDVGDYVIQARSQRLDVVVRDPQRRDATFEEVFRACAALGVAHRVVGTAASFHGDGSDEEIDVVDMHGRLGLELDPACSQGFCKDLLALADHLRPAGGVADLVGFAALLPGHEAAHHFAVLASVLFGGAGPSREHGLGAIARLDALANKLRANGRAIDAESFRERLNAVPFDVEPHHHLARVLFGLWRRAVDAPVGGDAPGAEVLGDQIARLWASESRSDFGKGHPFVEKALRVDEKRIGDPVIMHVFNLETSSHWYVAHGLISHNCRCYSEPDLSALLGD